MPVDAESGKKAHSDSIANIIPHFVRRVKTQSQQFRRWILTAIEETMSFAGKSCAYTKLLLIIR